MDNTTDNPVTERPGLGDHAVGAAESTPSEVVSVCAWCQQLNILRMQRRDTDIVIIYQQGKELRIIRNGTVLTVSHGICPEHSREVKS